MRQRPVQITLSPEDTGEKGQKYPLANNLSGKKTWHEMMFDALFSEAGADEEHVGDILKACRLKSEEFAVIS